MELETIIIKLNNSYLELLECSNEHKNYIINYLIEKGVEEKQITQNLIWQNKNLVDFDKQVKLREIYYENCDLLKNYHKLNNTEWYKKYLEFGEQLDKKICKTH